jgi:hypothetical protein
MNEPIPTVETWTAFATGLRQAGLRIFATSEVRETGDDKSQLQIAGLTLLARTLSNFKAALLLLREKQIVEARTIARCCYENSLWVLGLVKGGQKFKNEIIGHDMKHKRITLQTVFSSRIDLEEDREEKLRQWMRDTKHWETSGTLTPKGVAKTTADDTYIFYQYLSLDAHPSVHTLDRYFDPTDGDAGTIVIEAEVRLSEEIETLNLLCLPVVSVLLLVSQLLGHEEAPPELAWISQEYVRLTETTKL